jgi:hypothetical protein
MDKTNFFLSTLPFGPWAVSSFNHMATCRSSSENSGKMNLKPVLNKTSPRAHMELELDVLGVSGKLLHYVVYSSKRKKLKNI